MKVHLTKIADYVGIQGPGLISLLKKVANILPVIRTKGFQRRIHWSHHVHATRADDRMRRNATIRISPTQTKINQSTGRIVGTWLSLPSKSRTLLQWRKLGRELVLHPFEMQAAILRSRRRGEGSHERRAKVDWFLGCKSWPVFIA
jgi:hypothetical protein